MIFAYLIGTLYMITVLLLITIRSTEPRSEKKDDPLMNEDAESLGQVSNVSMSTAHSVSLPSNYGTIELSPEVSSLGKGSFLFNIHKQINDKSFHEEVALSG